MPNHTTFPLAPATPLQISNSSTYRPADHDQHKYCLKKPIYAVGVAPTTNPKEKISQFHSAHSNVAKAAAELESYMTTPDFKQSAWYLRFFGRLRTAMEKLNPLANEYEKSSMAAQFIDELINDGYVHCLRSLAVPSGEDYAAFARSYGESHNMPFGASLLFNPTGGARMALTQFLAAEKTHGQHRPTTPTALMTETSRKQWFNAMQTINWPTAANDQNCDEPLDIAQQQGKLPENPFYALRELWRRNPALRDYTGTNRLSGDIPFQIVEDTVDIVFRGSSVPSEIKQEYDKIIETANQQGMDSFYAVYTQLFSRKNQLRPYWDEARKMLCEYSLALWENQNERQVIEGKYSAADGVTCRPAKASARRPLKTSLPGTIYLNNGRYFWVVKDKMKPVGLVDDRNRRILPGTIGSDKGRYFWVVPGLLERQRLVAKGEKFRTTDRAIAEGIALGLWERIQEKQPKLAARIKARRPWGAATKDKTVAIKVARRMWKQIQQNAPELAAKILTDNRPVAQEHWIAQICAGGKHRHIGSFKSRKEAMAAYTKEFEKVFGYSPGYNVRYMPKLDKVWPTWQEEKARLERIKVKPAMPVIGITEQAQSLMPVVRRMQKVDWIVKHCRVVLENSIPHAIDDIAIESRGRNWLCEVKREHKRPVIYGSTAIEPDGGRIRITLFSPAYHNAAILMEEVYHLVYRIIGHTRSLFAEQIHRWHQNRMKAGTDPTLSEDEAFALAMAQKDINRSSTDLPGRVERYARKIFSTANTVSERVMHEIMAG